MGWRCQEGVRRDHAPAWGSVRKLGHHSTVYTCLVLGGPGFKSTIRKGLQAKECEKLLQAGESDPHASKGRADLRTPGLLGFPTCEVVPKDCIIGGAEGGWALGMKNRRNPAACSSCSVASPPLSH